MSATPPLNILAVEDDEAMRELLRQHLSNAGTLVTLAADTTAAGHRMLEFPPDLLILDVDLPYLNGLDLAAALLADASVAQIPIIFISADESFAPCAERLGAEFVAKPLGKARLLASVARTSRRGLQRPRTAD